MPAFRSGARRSSNRASRVYDDGVRHQCALGLPVPCVINCRSMFAPRRGPDRHQCLGERRPESESRACRFIPPRRRPSISLMRSAALEAAPRGVEDQRDRAGPRRDRHDAALGRRRHVERWRQACRCGGWDSPRKSPKPWSGYCPTRRPMSSATCWPRTEVFWLRSVFFTRTGSSRIWCGTGFARKRYGASALLRVEQRHRRIHHHLDQADAVMRQAALERRRKFG